MDTLTDVLRAMRLSGGAFLDAEFTAPWCIISQVEPGDCLPYMPVPSRLVAYHYVVEGALFLQVEGTSPRTAEAGQLLVLPRNDRHQLGSTPGVAPVDASALIEPGAEGLPARIRYGGGGPRSRILCGYLGTNDIESPLVRSLPTVMHLDLRAKTTGAWIEGSIEHAMRGLTDGSAGAAASLTRLAELLFAEAVREYVSSQPAEQRGWFGGLRDPVVGKSLALIHSQLDRTWTLETLSREVGSSRSVLTERFQRTLGVAPMQYLRRRRLARAAEELIHGMQTVSETAIAAGYETEAAFSRAFKQAFGSSPSAFRGIVRREQG
jgi:AraC-like DNA-binding protein